MAKRKLLVWAFLLFPKWSVCISGETGAVSQEPGSPESRASRDPRATPANSFRLPRISYVLDSETRTLRPLLGTPGAAFFGSQMDLGINLNRVWISPEQGFALAEVEGSTSVWLLDLESGAQVSKALPTLSNGADRVAMSPTGSAMVFYFGAERNLRIVSGLPSSSEVSAAVDLALVPGTLSSLAVSDDGRMVLVASNEAETATVYLVDDEEKRLIARGTNIQAVTFLARSYDAVAADAGTNEVRLVIDAPGTASSQTLADERNGISQPSALQPSISDNRIFILNAGDPAITTIDLTTRLVNHLPVDGPASRLQRLSGNVFQLTSDFNQPTLLLDAERPDSRIVFVPKLATSNTASRSASRNQPPQRRRPLPRSQDAP